MSALVPKTVGAQRSLRIALVLVGCTLACAVSATTAGAQVQLNRFFPPVVAAGQESTITAEGKFPKWPVNLNVDRETIEIRPEKDSGKLTVILPPDASPGVIWIRMFDEKSASELVPLIVTPVAVAIETEPNDKRSEANDLEIPSVVAGRLAKRGDSDAYRVSVKAGQQLVVNATANQVLKSPMDAVLQLSDLRGNVPSQGNNVARFNDIWNQNPGAVLVESETLVIRRINLQPLFREVLLTNNTANQAAVSFNNAAQVPVPAAVGGTDGVLQRFVIADSRVAVFADPFPVGNLQSVYKLSTGLGLRYADDGAGPVWVQP